MKRTLVFSLLFLMGMESAWAVRPDIRLCDQDAHCANITAAGELSISATNEGFTNANPASIKPDIRISDGDGHVVNISASNALQVST